MRGQTDRVLRGQDHNVRAGGTHRRLGELQCASIAHGCILASTPVRVKQTLSCELRERHARRRNGLERLGEMIQHRMRFAGNASPHADRCSRGDEPVGIGA